MKKYIASHTECCESEPQIINEYSSIEEAIDACVEYAYEDEDDFEDEEFICREALQMRGYYCVGYSTLCLMVDEIEK